MKDLLKSLKDNATSRLSNPIVGAFVLSWMLLNINGVARFLLEDNQGKLEIIKLKKWDFTDDLLFPFSISIAYLILLPVLNMVYCFIHDNCIDKIRDENRNNAQKNAFIRRKDTVGAKVESTDEYVMKIKDRELELWGNQKLELIREIISLKAKYSKLLSDFESKSKGLCYDNNLLSKSLESLELSNKNLLAEMLDGRDHIKRVATSLDRIANSLENTFENGFDVNEIEKIRKEVSSMRHKFNAWDEDIPF